MMFIEIAALSGQWCVPYEFDKKLYFFVVRLERCLSSVNLSKFDFIFLINALDIN